MAKKKKIVKKKKREKPIELDMSFDEAMGRLVKVKPKQLKK